MDTDIKTLSIDKNSSGQIFIGYLGPKILAPMQIKILSGIRKVAQKHDIVLFHFGGPYPHDPKEMIIQSSFIYKLISCKKIHGIIGWSSQLYNKNGFFYGIEEFLVRNPDFPVVFITKPYKNYPTVIIDNSHGIHEIMNHLIHVHNYRKIAYISGPEFHYNAMERYKAYVHALESNNIAFNPRLISPPYEFDSEFGVQAIRHFLDTLNLKPKQDIEAIVSVSDMFSYAAIEEFKKRNIRVPQDIAVVGFNNKYESLSSIPPITTIDVNFEGIGKDAMGLLLSILNGEKKTGIFRTPTKLIIRQSCGCIFDDAKININLDLIPVNKVKVDDSKKKLAEILIRKKVQIIAHINRKLDMLSRIDHKLNEVLFAGLIDSIKMESIRPFLNVFENIFEHMVEFNIDFLLLNQYLSELRETVLELTKDNNLKSWLEMSFYYANSLLIQQSERKAALKQIKMVNYEGRIIALYQSISSTYKLSTLLDILADKLPVFGIDACYFSLFPEPGKSIEYALLKLAYDSKGVYKLYDTEIMFKSTQLIPAEYYHKMDNLLYIILPLYFQDTPMGFIIFGISVLTELNDIFYEVLRSLISNSLQGAMDMQDLNFTQAQLEQKAEERKIAIQAANEANTQKTRFFINLAHETKTPLTIIRNYLALYMEQHPPDDKLQIIKQNIDILVANILNFMDIEKLQKGNAIFKHNSLVNLSASTENKCALFCEVANMKKISIICNVETNILIRIDPYALDRILNNLLDNAVKYIQEEGKIWITVSRKEGRAILQVKDNGPGLPVDTFEHIFEPYYLLSRNKTGQQGIGVGLSIVKKIVDELSASISVKKGSGRGACFTISFKENQTAYQPELLQDIPATPPAPLVRGKIKEKNISPKKPSILIVDDNIQLLKLIQSTLEEKYNIFLARDVQEAFFKLRIIPHPVLIIADIIMEGTDGFTFIRELSELDEYNDIPFIVLTALGGEEAKIQGLDSGAVDYIEKPFSIKELTVKINSIITLRYRQKEKELTHLQKNINQLFSRIKDDNFKKPPKINFKTLCEKFNLNEREERIFQLLLNGMTHKEIAFQLNISKRTVEYHLSKIYKKCNVNSKYGLIQKFLS